MIIYDHANILNKGFVYAHYFDADYGFTVSGHVGG